MSDMDGDVDWKQLYSNMDLIMNTDEFSKQLNNDNDNDNEKEVKKRGKNEKREKISKNSKNIETESTTKTTTITNNDHLSIQQQQLKIKKDKKNDRKNKINSLNLNSNFKETFWNFETDYNDHFETPLVAYIDIYNTIIEIAQILKKPLNELVIYDPYYCKGSTGKLLNQIFQYYHNTNDTNTTDIKKEDMYLHVINENRDFYQDIANKTVPKYDILITNPPYSGDHKAKLLNYIASTATTTSTTTSATTNSATDTKEKSENSPNNNLMKPFLLLLPLYTCTKSYWKQFIDSPSHTSLSTYYILPPDHYCVSVYICVVDIYVYMWLMYLCIWTLVSNYQIHLYIFQNTPMLHYIHCTHTEHTHTKPPPPYIPIYI